MYSQISGREAIHIRLLILQRLGVGYLKRESQLACCPSPSSISTKELLSECCELGTSGYVLDPERTES